MLFGDPNKISNEEIRQELAKAGYSISFIDEIIQQFWFHDWGNSFIAIPRHFQLLQRYLKENKSDAFSRFGFYQYFYQHVCTDYEKLGTYLQQLGLVFELM